MKHSPYTHLRWEPGYYNEYLEKCQKDRKRTTPKKTEDTLTLNELKEVFKTTSTKRKERNDKTREGNSRSYRP
jgi:hypothetical protein